MNYLEHPLANSVSLPWFKFLVLLCGMPDGSISRKLWDTVVHIMRCCSSSTVIFFAMLNHTCYLKELCSSKCTEMSEQLEDMLPICLSNLQAYYVCGFVAAKIPSPFP